MISHILYIIKPCAILDIWMEGLKHDLVLLHELNNILSYVL